MAIIQREIHYLTAEELVRLRRHAEADAVRCELASTTTRESRSSAGKCC